jgi:hypothetical protein
MAKGLKSVVVVMALSSLAWAAEMAATATSKATQSGHFVVSYSAAEIPAINRIHSWTLHVEDAQHHNVETAEITVSGGMPEHDHGLPTAPRMTRYLGDGNYLVEGMKFHMNGHWQVTVSIAVENVSDTVIFDLEL